MSQFINKLANMITITRHKPSESASRRSGQDVGDSVRTIQDHKTTNKQATSTFFGFILLSLVALPATLSALLCSSAYADSITITIDKPTVNLDIASRNANGTFSKSAASTVSVKTTNSTGYTLGIRSSGSEPNKLINSNDSDTSTNHLTSITSSTTIDQFKALAATTLNGKWGYMPSRYCIGDTSSTCSNNTDTFFKAPTTGDTLDVTTAANPTTANTYELAVGARIDSTQKLGTYNNTYVIYADANAIPYSIVYDDNVVSNMPSDVNSGQATGGQLNIASNTPTRSGYKFLGWCTVATSDPASSTSDCATAGGTFYSPNQSVTIASATNFHLYAMWAQPCAGYTTMQGLTSSTIATLLPSVGSTATVCDIRDENTYTIAKLKDNKYWMVSNLNLAGGTALDSTNTDMNAGANMSTSNGFQSGNKLPASSTSGFSSNTMAYVYNSGNNTTTCNSTTPCNSYYSWTAATLGSGLSITTDNTDADSSICPKGWHLPNTRTGTDSSSDFRALMIGYGGSASVATYNSSTSPTGATMFGNIGPNSTTPNFLLAGNYSNGSFYDGGSYGNYWSATSRSSTGARSLYFNSSFVYSAYSSNRYYGFSVRCVFGE